MILYNLKKCFTPNRNRITSTVHSFTVGQLGKISRNFTEIDCLENDFTSLTPPPLTRAKKNCSGFGQVMIRKNLSIAGFF